MSGGRQLNRTTAAAKSSYDNDEAHRVETSKSKLETCLVLVELFAQSVVLLFISIVYPSSSSLWPRHSHTQTLQCSFPFNGGLRCAWWMWKCSIFSVFESFFKFWLRTLMFQPMEELQSVHFPQINWIFTTKKLVNSKIRSIQPSYN